MKKNYRFQCPRCETWVTVERRDAGHEVFCPTCQKMFEVDTGIAETAPPEESATPETRLVAEDGVPRDWRVGDRILGLYEVKDILGQGGMGMVFRVHHRRWNVDLAVKSPKPDLLSDERCTEAFNRECETWVNLGLHPNVVSCFYTRTLGGIPRIFAELVEGDSLQKWIRSRKLYGEAPEAALARILTASIHAAWGLHHAHEQGVIHRDVKAGNVLLMEDGVAKVTDFGLATARARVGEISSSEESSQASSEGMTPIFCSPEQALFKKVTKATDAWSLGLMVMHALCGGVVWKAGPQAPEAIDSHLAQGKQSPGIPPIPRRLIELLRWCCQSDPNSRPKTMLDIAGVLEEIYRKTTGGPFPHRYPKTIEHRAETINNRAVSLLDLGKREEAFQQWEHALRVAPRHVESSYNFDLVRWRVGRISDKDLLHTMDELATLHPGQLLPLRLLIQVHLERGDYAAVLDILPDIEEIVGPAAVAGVLRYTRENLEKSRRLIRTYEGHGDSVNTVRISRNGLYALSGSEDNTLRLWEVETGTCVREFTGHTGSVLAADLAHNGQLALSGGADRIVRMWDVSSARCIHVFKGHGGAVESVALSRDLARAVSASVDGGIKLWNLSRGECLGTLRPQSGHVTSVAVSRDMGHVVSGSEDGKVMVWLLTEGLQFDGHDEPGHTFEGHEGAVSSIWVDPGGAYALSCSADRTMKLWNLREQTCVRTFKGHRDEVTDATLTPDGRYAVSSGLDETVRMWEVSTGRCLRTFEGHKGAVRSVDVSRNPLLAISGGKDGLVRLWNLGADLAPRAATLHLCRALRSETAASVGSVFRQTMEQARSALKAGDPKAAAAKIQAARSQPGYLRAPEAMREWARLYRIFPKKSPAGYWEVARLIEHSGPVKAIAATRDGRHAVSCGADSTLRLWDLDEAQYVRTFEGHMDEVNCLSLDPNGRFALSGSMDNSLRQWNLETGECMRVFTDNVGQTAAVGVSPDGRFAASGAWDVKLWDLASGQCLLTFPGQPVEVACLCWSPSGRLIFAGCSEAEVRIYDVVTGECLQLMTGHKGTVYLIDVSGDGQRVISGSRPLWGGQGEIQVWELESGKALRPLKKAGAMVSALSISLDGRYASLGNTDGTMALWDLTTGQCTHAVKVSGDAIRATCLTRDGRYALAATDNGAVVVAVLDWELDTSAPSRWDRGIEPFLRNFAVLHKPPSGTIPLDRPPTEKEITAALTRRGRASWTDRDFSNLLSDLGYAGYGQAPLETVRTKLNRMASRSENALLPSLKWLNKLGA